MGNTRNSYLWYYAICATRCTNSMHGISRFNGIFYSGRRKNYQTSSIPSRLAPMSFYFLFYFKEKKKAMPSPYEIWILSNNSMAFRIQYKKFFLFRFNIRLCIERVVWDIRGSSDFIGSLFQCRKLFFCFHTRRFLMLFILLWIMKEDKKKKDYILFSFFFIWKKKETLGLLNHRWNKATEPP